MNTISKMALVLLYVFATIGCSVLGNSPAADSGFIEHAENMEEHRERYPFNAVWVSEKYKRDKATYTKIIIRPINTSYLLKTADWKHLKSRSTETIHEDAKRIAIDIETSLRTALQSKQDSAVKLVNDVGPNTLILEAALTELVPTDLTRNAAGDVAGFYVMGSSLLVSAGAGGSVAIEARFRDAATNEILWMFKDRETDRIAPIDLAGLTPYRHVENNITIWAKELVQLLNTPMDEKITQPLPFTLLPW